ncbi:MAG: imidazole glycerol phosphate synthase subunit HisH [Gammaproteobacteria bacterium]|nr:imidazole glycerol phosphate synthase subunit HisH [Gammaproteobacteria bacterium]
MQTVAVVDYGMGNLHSVAKALEQVGGGSARVRVSAEPAVIGNADRVVVPGQGAARDCMQALQKRRLIGAVKDALATRPFLGICMGLQLLLETSDENGGVDLLGFYAGRVRGFSDSLSAGHNLKIPHMGWNNVRQERVHPLFADIDDGARFYFVHSYFVVPEEAGLGVASAEYGMRFCCALASENVFACQFHPEKSAADGLRLLRNFLSWDGAC